MDKILTDAVLSEGISLDGFSYGSVLVHAASENLKRLISAHCHENTEGSVFVVLENDDAARRFHEKLGLEDAMYYPENPVMHEYIDTRSPELTKRRVHVTGRLLEGGKNLVVLSVNALLEKNVFFKKEDIIKAGVGDEIGLENLISALARLGYSREPEVSGPGAFLVKGGIVDVFVMGDDNPLRIEFFDDEIDSVRMFDVESGQSIEELESFTLRPAKTSLIDGETLALLRKKLVSDINRRMGKKRNESVRKSLLAMKQKAENDGSDITKYVKNRLETKALFDLADNPVFIVTEYSQVKNEYSWFLKQTKSDLEDLYIQGRITKEQKNNHFDFGYFEEALKNAKSIVFYDLSMPRNSLFQRELIELFSVDNHLRNKDLKMAVSEVKRFLGDGWQIYLTYRNEEERGLIERTAEDYSLEGHKNLHIAGSSLEEGFQLQGKKVSLFTLKDLGLKGSVSKEGRKKKRKRKASEAFFSEIKRGDFVVHDQHGIGRYVGMVSMEAGGTMNDYLEIEFAGSDRLYVNANQMDMVSRYVGSDDSKPRLSRLGTKAWENMKERTLRSVRQLADEYIEMYAARQKIKGYAFGSDTVWQKSFEDRFEHELTEDQKRCLDEIKKDMEKEWPMDRLLCGDVGFGKTEVALRAAFKAVMDSKQVAVLVPTTILAMQHYNTFHERLEDFPVNVEMLSRFKSPAEAKDIIERVNSGQIDIIIGTHSLLSDKVVFQDLGLLIVDEEQRFGVAHKDRLKVLKHSVDTLTLSATPIPRTLNMSLVGIRDLSTIENPPKNRQETETYVTGYDEFIIRDAIRREISRNGQVFFVYNSVLKADSMKKELDEMLPDVRVEYVNGQMPSEKIEDIMIRFLDRKFDVLVCTSIIESGLNVLNANTMIIKDAQNFGLSQLYQLRGRVGRSDKNAYCYITYDTNRALSDTAKKRLKAIEEFTRFGSGFQIAVRDLQIRGAGNLLGASQSGHFANVGYEMYTRMLREAFEGKKDEREKPDTVVAIKTDAVIDSSYMENEMDRIRAYKKIAAIKNEDDRTGLIDEFVDLYGDVPKNVALLMDVSLLRHRARDVYVERVSNDRRFIYLDFDPKNEINTDMLASLHESCAARLVRNDRFIRVGFPYQKKRNLSEHLIKAGLDIIEKMEGFVL